jgi:hypothetical protein
MEAGQDEGLYHFSCNFAPPRGAVGMRLCMALTKNAKLGCCGTQCAANGLTLGT